MDFLTLRRRVIEKYFNNMNDRQFEAVTTVNGPLLVLAGAGSGKTTVLVNRILNLIKFGDAYQSDYTGYFSDEDLKIAEDYINGNINDIPDRVFAVSAANPWQILAITFTNKAAGELKDRIAAKLGDLANDVWAGTFHSICGKILRRNAERLGFSSHFTVYDTDDQRRLMKEILKTHNIDDKMFPHKFVLSAISSAKDQLITPEEYEASVGNDYRQKTIAKLYAIYQNSLKKADAMDFDDMIVKTVELLQNNEDLLEYYSNKFRYVLVDEYQDTNHAQYVLISLLASAQNNLCVVGDDDQSIYKFRGATIENILSFEDEYKGAKIIRLEQNYRSTSNILDAANAVIKNNRGRKGKTLWTNNGEGEKLLLYTATDERDEAQYVADIIFENVRKGMKFSDHAILYRMNAQSNAIESAFLRSGIAYKVIGGIRFYDRKEVKDIIAYLQLINNNSDDLRLRRIINEPKRGIGDTTVNKAAEIAASLGVSIFEVLNHCDEYAPLSRASAKIKEFCNLINSLTELSTTCTISELFENVLEKTGYSAMLSIDDPDAKDRLDNVKEFGSTIAQYEFENDEPNLAEFLEQLALISDIDALENDNDDHVVLMTVHSAKGLEFDNVFLVGMEEGIFPGNQSIYMGPEEIEEERRLCYVAITRAKKRLTVTNAYSRMMFGSTTRNAPSRFLREIPEEHCVAPYSSYKSQTVKVDSSFVSSSYTSNFSYSNSFTGSSFAQPKTENKSDYKVGMTVNHKTFGSGVIISVTPTGSDTLLEIAFENVGTKKIMANYAKLTF